LRHGESDGAVANDRRRMLATLSVTTLASFLTGFNARLAVVGYPVIMRSLGADVWKMIWIIQGYMLGSTAVQLLLGEMADARGRVKLFSLGTLVFTAGTALSGLSPDPYTLVASRLLQGVGGGFLMSLSVTLLADNVPPERLATWLGVNQTAWRAGALIGLSVSGVLIDTLGWRSIFLVQVPVGVAAYIWTSGRLRESYRPPTGARPDYGRVLAVTLSVASLLLALTLNGYGYPGYSAAFFAASAALFAFFLALSASHGADFRRSELLRNWKFVSSVLTQFLYSVGFGATMLLFSLTLEAVHGLSPTKTGILLVPFEASLLVSGLAGGRVSDVVGREAVSSLGLALTSASLLMASLEPVVSSVRALVALQVLYGAGAGLFIAPNTSIIMTSVPPTRRGIASSIRSLSFNVGFLLSLNVALLSLTSVIPYSAATQLISGAHAAGGFTLQDLMAGMRRAFRDLGAIMLLSFAISLVRGRAPAKHPQPA